MSAAFRDARIRSAPLRVEGPFAAVRTIGRTNSVMSSSGLVIAAQLTALCVRNPMAQGTIKKVAEKGFGFISSDRGDVFFHLSSLSEGLRFEDLTVGAKVEYEIGQSPRGPRAENVRIID